MPNKILDNWRSNFPFTIEVLILPARVFERLSLFIINLIMFLVEGQYRAFVDSVFHIIPWVMLGFVIAESSGELTSTMMETALWLKWAMVAVSYCATALLTAFLRPSLLTVVHMDLLYDTIIVAGVTWTVAAYMA